MNTHRNDRGFISRIILVVVALIALKYFFHFDLIEWIKSDSGQKIVGPFINIIKSIYSYLDTLVKGWVSK